MRGLPLDIGTIHFVGVGGIGMSSIAEILHNLGYHVQGSDVADGYNVKRLRELGVAVVIGHKAENITGASVVVINRTQARRLGYSLNASDFVHRVNTANGSINAASISLREVKIDRIRIRDVQAVVLDDAALTNALIGMSFLRQLASYEFRDGTLFLNQ